MRAHLNKTFFTKLYVDGEKIAEHELREPLDVLVGAHREYVTVRADALLDELAAQSTGALTGPSANNREISGGPNPLILRFSGWSNAAMVDLIGTYSNHRDLSDLLKRARRWLSEGHRAPLEPTIWRQVT